MYKNFTESKIKFIQKEPREDTENKKGGNPLINFHPKRQFNKC